MPISESNINFNEQLSLGGNGFSTVVFLSGNVTIIGDGVNIKGSSQLWNPINSNTNLFIDSIETFPGFLIADLPGGFASLMKIPQYISSTEIVEINLNAEAIAKKNLNSSISSVASKRGKANTITENFGSNKIRTDYFRAADDPLKTDVSYITTFQIPLTISPGTGFTISMHTPLALVPATIIQNMFISNIHWHEKRKY